MSKTTYVDMGRSLVIKKEVTVGRNIAQAQAEVDKAMITLAKSRDVMASIHKQLDDSVQKLLNDPSSWPPRPRKSPAHDCDCNINIRDCEKCNGTGIYPIPLGELFGYQGKRSEN
jgi:hypothetical protein